MKLLASLILPTFCQFTWPVATKEWPPKNVTKCGINEKWDSCGNPCKEKNCQDRVSYNF